MQFSIVTSFHNQPPSYITDVAQSVISQTFDDWEWIITDDFSDSDTKFSVLNLTRLDSRIRYVQCHPHEFYWNPHLYARGSIVVVLDADDRLAPHFLEVANNIWNSVFIADISCVHFNSLHYHKEFDSDKFVKIRNCTPWEGFTNYRHMWVEYYRGWDKRLGELWGGIRTFRNPGSEFKFLREYNYVPVGEDMVKMFHLERMGKVLYIDRPLHFVRVYDNSQRDNVKYGNLYNSLCDLIPYTPPAKYTLSNKLDSIRDIVRSTNYSSLVFESTRKRIQFFPEVDSTYMNSIFCDHDIVNTRADYIFCRPRSIIDVWEAIQCSGTKELNILVENESLFDKIRIELAETYEVKWFVQGNHFRYIKIEEV